MSKLILITGISKGLGYAMTEGFIQQGHTVIGCARSSDAIDYALRFGKLHEINDIERCRLAKSH